MNSLLATLIIFTTTLVTSPEVLGRPVKNQANLQTYREVAQITAETCSAPQTVGWTLNAKGSAVVGFSLPKMMARFADVGVKLRLTGSYERWSGPLKRDVGSALVARSNCQRDVFLAMLDHLPLADPTNGRAIPRPRQPLIIYRIATQNNYFVAPDLATTPAHASSLKEVTVGHWRQQSSNAGACPTCAIEITPEGTGVRVVGNNDWTAHLEGDGHSAYGSGTMRFNAPLNGAMHVSASISKEVLSMTFAFDNDGTTVNATYVR